MGAAQRRVVFVKKGDTFEPRAVRLGVSNYEFAEVLSGVKEGEEVALLSAAQLQFLRFSGRLCSGELLPHSMRNLTLDIQICLCASAHGSYIMVITAGMALQFLLKTCNTRRTSVYDCSPGFT